MTAVVCPLKQQAVPVKDLLTELVGEHTFRKGKNKESRKLFTVILPVETTMSCANGQFTVPAGSVLVVYRHPQNELAANVRLATVHHPCKKFQTVIWGDGKAVTSKTPTRGMLDGPRQCPQVYLSNGDNW